MGSETGNLSQLLEHVENYQDIELPDGEVLPGKRSVDDRYKMIKPFLRDGLYFDVGSNFGGFSRRIAKDFNSVIISFEANQFSAEIQRILLEMHRINNVILISTPFSPSLMSQILSPVELVDGFLFLNILHHFAPDWGGRMLENSAMCIPDTFVELPSDLDMVACGQGSTAKLNRMLTELNFKEIGISKSHTGENRALSVRSNSSIERSGDSYLGTKRSSDFRKNFTFSGGEWSIKELDYQPSVGVNIWNVLEMGTVLHPSKDTLADMATGAYKNVIDSGVHVEDIRPWNLIFTPFGMKAIDFSDRMNGEDDYSLSKISSFFLGKYVDWDEPI